MRAAATPKKVACGKFLSLTKKGVFKATPLIKKRSKTAKKSPQNRTTLSICIHLSFLL